MLLGGVNSKGGSAETSPADLALALSKNLSFCSSRGARMRIQNCVWLRCRGVMLLMGRMLMAKGVWPPLC